MDDWQERITHETAPAIRVEHDVRYAAAAPLILDSAVWIDLGCGSGVSAAAALGGRFTGQAILVDVEESAVEKATAELGLRDAVGITADLSNDDGVQRVRDALRDAPAGPRVATCFETIEHLERFVPLVDALVELADGDDLTVALSVPNDAHWSIENPYHVTAWGEGAFEELRGLLPPDHRVARQVPLTGSALVLDETGRYELPVEVSSQRVPSHFLAAFGPRAARFIPTAAVEATDLEAERRWQRERDSYLVVLEARAAELKQIADDPIQRLNEFRTYIHELEERLGIERSGSTA